MYQHPGVYIEHAVSSALAVEASSTSVTAFLGNTRRGARVTAAGGAPVFVTSASQYAAHFGPLGGGPGGIKDAGTAADAMGHAINLYFLNGGTKAYVVPVANTAGTAATLSLAFEDGTRHALAITASSPGAWSNGAIVRIEKEAGSPDYALIIGTEKLETPVQADPALKKFDTVLERIGGLSLDPARPNFITERVKQFSSLVTVVHTVPATVAAPTALPKQGVLASGTDMADGQLADFTAALTRLRDLRDISIMVLPGQLFQAGQASATIYDAALTHAEFMQNRMVIVDPAPGVALGTPAEVTAAQLPNSTYAALYHPQLTVQNPYYNAENAPTKPRTFAVGPAAMAAGLWARIDGTRGVWKTPAGLEATVRGTLGPTLLIGNDLQDNLNEFGVNCLRSIIGPTVIWGGRTLATKARPQFRYISVRRTQSMIGESLYRALQAVVFEPNDHKLWGALRASASDFMDGLHRSGAFQGEKASDAWYVRCGLGATMTQGDIDAGIVRLVVGFAPLKPAEFVVVEIQQKVAQTA